MKLAEVLFREPWLAYQVLDDELGEDRDYDNCSEWDLQPLLGSTLAAEDVDDIFQGLFIIAAQIISRDAVPQSCYMDLVLPERIAEHHFLLVDGRITIRRGLHLPNGTVIPAIGIEKFGDYSLFYAKENPSAGVDVLRLGMEKARDRWYLADDLRYLLRDEKRYEEAIEALTVVLTENLAPHALHMLYRERSQMYAALGQVEKAEADKHLSALAFQKKVGRPPGPHEM